MKPAVALLVGLVLLAPLAHAGWYLESYRWSPTSTTACADAATSCVPVAHLRGVQVGVFAQDDALGPEHHYVRHELAFLDASGAVLGEPPASCPTTRVVVPADASTLRVHVVLPTAEDLAEGRCGVPMRGGIVVYW